MPWKEGARGGEEGASEKERSDKISEEGAEPTYTKQNKYPTSQRRTQLPINYGSHKG